MWFVRLKEKIEKKYNFFTQAAEIAINQFLVLRNSTGEVGKSM
jgi:predicted metal-dependent peptidase